MKEKSTKFVDGHGEDSKISSAARARGESVQDSTDCRL